VISVVQVQPARQFPANSYCANSVRDHECHARLLKTIDSILRPLSFGLRDVVLYAPACGDGQRSRRSILRLRWADHFINAAGPPSG
jgi:hypothetical protein